MVYLSKYKKKIIPGYVAPMEDEVFSSWLCRFADSLLVSTLDVMNSYIGDYTLCWDRDVDISSKKELEDFISNFTPLKVFNFRNLFLDSYDGIYFLNDRVTGITRHFLSLGLTQ